SCGHLRGLRAARSRSEVQRGAHICLRTSEAGSSGTAVRCEGGCRKPIGDARTMTYHALMSTPLPIGQQVLYTYVALQNLAEGRALNDIADEIGRSRFATARMVRRARELGLVEVRAAVADPIDVSL